MKHHQTTLELDLDSPFAASRDAPVVPTADHLDDDEDLILRGGSPYHEA